MRHCLCGAWDIFLVRHEDHLYKSSEWCISFGSFSVLSTKEKFVKIYLNENLLNFQLVFGENGFCEFQNEEKFFPSDDQIQEIIQYYNPKIINQFNFEVDRKFSSPKHISCHFFVFNSTDKIAVSDVDGTVTKSNFMGIVRTDKWIQPSLVLLYNSISQKGIKFFYLSARPFAGADQLRGIFQSFKENELGFPPGPIICSPEKVAGAIFLEIAKRSQEFKIPLLQKILSLFHPYQPFVIGFGNAESDILAYRSIEIDPKKNHYC